MKISFKPSPRPHPSQPNPKEQTIQAQINTDRNIEIDETMAAPLREKVEYALSRFSDHIMRVEQHLSDENADKSGQHDKVRQTTGRDPSEQP